MCLNAEASFAAASLVGAAGLVAISSVRDSRQLVLATLPLGFAVHQAAEAVTWRYLDSSTSGTCAGTSVTVWVVFAWALVPGWLSLGVSLVETDARRRRAMGWLVGLGLLLAPVWLWQALSPDVYARATGGHLEYPLPEPEVGWLVPAYLLVALVPPLISSHVWLRRLGSAGVVSALITTGVSLYTWPSLWCLCAAALSVLVVAHLRSVSPSGAPLAGPSSRPAGSTPTAGEPSR